MGDIIQFCFKISSETENQSAWELKFVRYCTLFDTETDTTRCNLKIDITYILVYQHVK